MQQARHLPAQEGSNAPAWKAVGKLPGGPHSGSRARRGQCEAGCPWKHQLDRSDHQRPKRPSRCCGLRLVSAQRLTRTGTTPEPVLGRLMNVAVVSPSNVAVTF